MHHFCQTQTKLTVKLNNLVSLDKHSVSMYLSLSETVLLQQQSFKTQFLLICLSVLLCTAYFTTLSH